MTISRLWDIHARTETISKKIHDNFSLIYLFEVFEEDFEPLGHFAIGAALDDVLHHGAL